MEIFAKTQPDLYFTIEAVSTFAQKKVMEDNGTQVNMATED